MESEEIKMNEKILMATVEYLAKKQNPDEEDLKNEKRAWEKLVEAGIKKESDIPERAREKAIPKPPEPNIEPPKPTPKKTTTQKAATPK